MTSQTIIVARYVGVRAQKEWYPWLSHLDPAYELGPRLQVRAFDAAAFLRARFEYAMINAD